MTLYARLVFILMSATCFGHAVAFSRFGTPAQAKAAFIRSKLVPDVFPRFDPILTLGITYRANGTTVQGNLGTSLTIAGKAFSTSEESELMIICRDRE